MDGYLRDRDKRYMDDWMSEWMDACIQESIMKWNEWNEPGMTCNKAKRRKEGRKEGMKEGRNEWMNSAKLISVKANMPSMKHVERWLFFVQGRDLCCAHRAGDLECGHGCFLWTLLDLASVYPSRKLTWQWNINHLKMYCLLKMVDFTLSCWFSGVYCYFFGPPPTLVQSG